VTMVREAIAHGVTALDTARGYGESEQVVGEALSGAWRSRVEVITKLDPLASVAHDADAATVCAAVDESVSRSCAELRQKELGTLLLHRWHHYSSWGGTAWHRLLDLRDQGLIASLGASVYAPQEALDVLREPEIHHLQIPMNVLDWRWKESGVSQALADRPDVVVHARSAFLQGMLINSVESWPTSVNYDGLGCVRELCRLARRFDRQSVADLCLAYVRSQPWITSVVVGCETLSQLEEILGLFRLPKMIPEQCDELERSLPVAPEDLLNPSQWTLVHE
jgi:aryl-alcohol dehydrogenase-like predicted oxidoreductase